MTNIRMTHTGNHYSLRMTGHAGHGTAGNDIVCAGISAITYAYAEFLAESDSVQITEMHLSPGDVNIACYGAAGDAWTMALAGFRLLENQYPDNVFVDLPRKDANSQKP